MNNKLSKIKKKILAKNRQPRPYEEWPAIKNKGSTNFNKRKVASSGSNQKVIHVKKRGPKDDAIHHCYPGCYGWNQ